MQLERRKFIQTSAAALAGSFLFPKASKAFFSPNAMHPVGIQLFTFFNVIDTDVQGTLKKIAGIGYKEIESAFSKKGGFYGMKPKEFNDMLSGMGLSWKSHHVLGAPFKLPPGTKMPTGEDGKPMVIPPMQNLRDNMQEIVDTVKEGGAEYLVCANIPTNTGDDIKEAVDVLSKTDEACKKAGLVFAYHNHDMEFKTIDGQVPYDVFLTQTKMQMELDLCWVTKAGKDPVELFKQHEGRFPLWHVKDLDKAMTGPQPVGTGIIDWKRIFANASNAGMKHFFVEHDMPKDAWASVTESYNYLTKTVNV